jgi:hypothetical protein
MIIQVVGLKTDQFKRLHSLTLKALQDLEIDAEITRVDDEKLISTYHIKREPGLVINDKLKLYGRVPCVDELKRMILEEQDT